MKVLLCAINTKYIHSSLAPWCLFGALKESSFDGQCSVVEGTINEDKKEIIRRIMEHEFDLIGFSAYIWNISYVKELAREIKERTGAKILFGGPEVSYNPSEVMKESYFIDYVISGEGEEPIVKLCNGEDPKSIEGLCYRIGGEVAVKEPYVSNKEPPSPYVKEYLEQLSGRIAYIESSRGCPFRCAFCLSGRCGGVRFFSLEATKEKIILLANSGTQTVKFIDRTFNADRKRAREIFEFIISEYGKNVPGSVCFHFEIEGELIDDETVEVLKKAPKGLFQFEIGLQSYNKETLLGINRSTDLDLLEKNIRKILSLGNIHVHIDLIAGLPYESYESFKKSFNRAYSLSPHMLQLGFLKLLHGSDLREKGELLPCEYSKNAPYEVISTKWITKNELKKLHLVEDVFEKMYNSGRFSLTCEYLTGLFDSPFSAFEALTEYIMLHPIENTLDAFSRAIYDCFTGYQAVNSAVLRDKMAIDRLSTNRMGALPYFLKVKSPEIKRILNELDKCETTKRKVGVKRSATVLLSENKLVYVDYTEPDKINNKFQINTINLD